MKYFQNSQIFYTFLKFNIIVNNNIWIFHGGAVSNLTEINKEELSTMRPKVNSSDSLEVIQYNRKLMILSEYFL